MHSTPALTVINVYWFYITVFLFSSFLFLGLVSNDTMTDTKQISEHKFGFSWKNVLLNITNESQLDTKSNLWNIIVQHDRGKRCTAINDFVELFPFVVAALEKISEWKDITVTDANILLNDVDSEF